MSAFVQRLNNLLLRNLGVQVTLAFIVLTLVATVTFTFHTARKEAERTTQMMLQQAQVLAHNLSVTTATHLSMQDHASIESLLSKSKRFPGITEVQVSDPVGNIVAEVFRSRGGEPVARPHRPLLTPPNKGMSMTRVDGKQMKVWEPVEREGTIGWVRVVYDLGVIDKLTMTIWRDSLFLSAVLISTAVTLLLMAMRGPLHAVRRYTAFSDRLDENNGEQIEVDTSSFELEKLGSSLNLASQSLFDQSKAVTKALTEVRRVAALAENNPNVVVTLDDSGKPTYMNTSAKRMLFEDIRKESDIYSYLPGNINELRKKCMTTGETISGIEVSVNRRILSWALSPFQNQQVLHCYAINVSKRRQAEQALSESESRYRMLFDSANDAIVLLEDGKCVECNPVASTMFGVAREDIIGRPLYDFSPPHQPGGKNSKKVYESAMQNALAGEPQSFEWSCYSKKGNAFYSEMSLTSFELSGKYYLLSIIRDITERKEAEEKLLHQANFDSLTELPNRLLALDRLSQAIKQAHRSNYQVALMFIDIDQFKKVNDTLGHAIGDQLLIDVGKRLLDCVCEGDTVARLGGDEFLIIACGLVEAVEAEQMAEKILISLSQPYTLQSREFFFSASIGITSYPDDSDDPDTMLRNADAAMYQAKESGRNAYRFYTPAINGRAKIRLDIEGKLRHAISKNEMYVEYQPQIDIQNQKLIGAEALLRWRNPDLGFVPPDRFIPFAEDMGLMNNIGEWILRRACYDAITWIEKSPNPLRIAVNVSATQFKDNKLQETVSLVLNETNFPPEMLELEITESMLIEDAPQIARTLEIIKRKGVFLALDDFGTGYCSLSYLKKFPFDVLKIDRAFINNVMRRPDDAALCKAIIAMASSLNLQVVGEGVETDEQVDFLRRNGANIGQGYYYSKSLGAPEFEQFMLRWNREHENKYLTGL